MESSLASLFEAGVVGYLAGSVSGARIVGNRTRAGKLDNTTVIIDGTETSVDLHGADFKKSPDYEPPVTP